MDGNNVMYVVLKKVEVIRKVIGPFTTRDAAVAHARKLKKNSKSSIIVRKVDYPNDTNQEALF